MEKWDLVIRGGKIILLAEEVPADVAVSGGKIARVGSALRGRGATEIDAIGLHVFPGIIDAHVHFNETGRTEWEGFSTGSAALAAGGGTCFFDMPLNSSPPTLDGESFDLKRRAAEPTLEQSMKIAARLGLPVAVHAEDQQITSRLTAQSRNNGPANVHDYLATRPIAAEIAAIDTALRLAGQTGCSLHIVHVSSPDGGRLIAQNKGRISLTAETCPHYLAWSDHDVQKIGAAVKCSPPPRAPDQVARLTAQNVARQVGLPGKGEIAGGFDADLALVELAATYTLQRDQLLNRHLQSPDVGREMPGVVRRTILRGRTIFIDGKIIGPAQGHFLTPRRRAAHD